ncbi:hypothetical protein PG637_02345 [Riemerella anatipestifer]|nr:hypothetical protein [Riemerella anatipestifer]MDY3324511.1 hypothetical protein [Riemerella anatipestifer]MDY3353322.1 hypothetical protein [Riemerella anatipestifer]
MSRTRIVKGNITKIIGGNYKRYSKDDIVNIGSKVIQIGKEGGVTYGEPEKVPPVNLINYYLKIRIKEQTKLGEFGFDWLDINPSTGEIEKVQGVDLSNLEYFYKEGSGENDLGNIVSVNGEENEAEILIKKIYKSENFLRNCVNGLVDTPFILIKPNQEISLSVEVNIPENEMLVDEKIYIEDDEYYEFEFVNGIKDFNKKKSEIKITSNKEVLELKVKCIKESAEIRYTILQENIKLGKVGIPVGGFVMMENKVLKLKFRVIALVSKDGTEMTKSIKLLQDFVNSNIIDYLNSESLNQAGYEILIENLNDLKNLTTSNVNDYFYAFDKIDWTEKKYFANIVKEKYDVIPGTNRCKPTSVDSSGNCNKISVNTDVIVNDLSDLGEDEMSNEIDYVVIKEYRDKLNSLDKVYTGGLIILSEFESSTSKVGAFSRSSPLNHYTLFIYSKNVKSKETYAHEIGHMLGLSHIFYEAEELKNLNISKNNYQTMETRLLEKQNEDYSFYNYTLIRAKIDTLKTSLTRFIDNRKKYIDVQKNLIKKAQSASSNTNFKDEKNKIISRGEFIKLAREKINIEEKYIEQNRNALKLIESSGMKDFEELEADCHILKDDSITISKQLVEFYKKELEQIKSNSLRFKKSSTQNIMDYNNTGFFFLSHQIRIMRNDIKNYEL